MTTFDSFSDVSSQLKTEGDTITLSLKQGVPSIGNASIDWNIPTPALGCGGDGVYSGMVILLHKEPLKTEHIPTNGTTYVADPSADENLHVGDRINGALVVGAFYECDKKGNGEALTSSTIITNLDPDGIYYVAGYATDCQKRYHSDGVRAYSDEYGGAAETNNPAKQIIEIKTNESNCILPSDGTGLLPGATYQFDLVVDSTYPIGNSHQVIEFDISGSDVGTYQSLLDSINASILRAGNPPQSPVLPNMGGYYWNSQSLELFSFDGINHIPTPTINSPTDPTLLSTPNQYWYNPGTEILRLWNNPIAATWNNTILTKSITDPTLPSCSTYWVAPTIVRRWNGSVWCDLPTLIQTTDPDCCNIPTCGSWWYDETNMKLLEWNSHDNKWGERTALYWDVAPNALVNGTYWFNSTNNTLNVLNGLVWDDISTTSGAYIQGSSPVNVATGTLWYNPTTEELSIFDLPSNAWTSISIIVWATDPMIVESCDAWWRSTDNELLQWDTISSSWVIVTSFEVSSIDPIYSTPLIQGQAWFNTATNVLSVWDSGVWTIPTDYIISLTPPNTPAVGNVWLDTTNNIWYVFGTPLNGWNVIAPIIFDSDPHLVPTNTFWFDTTNNTLNVRNGVSWTNMTYSTTPLSPNRGYQWFNTTTNQLLEWNGTGYEQVIPIAIAEFGDCGIEFTSTSTGSSSFVMIPVMNAPNCTATGYAASSTTGTYAPTTCGMMGSGGLTKEYPVRHLSEQAFLWDALKDAARLSNPIIGSDGVPSIPSYDTLGVGDDGTPDERRELAHSIRSQLGYPVVEVELTPYQLDTAIQGALESFRKRSSMAYRREFFFLDIEAQQQKYLLTNKQIGYNTIVAVTSAHRVTSAFLSNALGGGVHGQIAVQQLYGMGKMDLTSFHLVAQYIDTMQDMFATRLVFNWNETNRTLGFFQSFHHPEQVLLDCQVERTEQDLMTDRYTKTWIERYALAESMTILARIRGKYASGLPGAGGGVSLDAADLMATAEGYRQDLMAQLDDFIVQDMEGVGMHGSFVFGG